MEEQRESVKLIPHLPTVHSGPAMYSKKALARSTAAFCMGALSGAAGGLMLGATAVAMVQSFELLDDNRMLMDQLETYTADYCNTSVISDDMKELLQWKSDCETTSVHLSLFVLWFGLFSLALSVPVGCFYGSLTYASTIKNYGEAAKAKARILAGAVCVAAVTATGCGTGLAFEQFLSMTANANIFMWLVIAVLPMVLLPVHAMMTSDSYVVKAWLLAPGTALCSFALGFVLKWRLTLVLTFGPVQLCLRDLRKSYLPRQVVATVPLMLILSDLFNYTGQPIVSLQSPNATNTDSPISEDLFVGILASQLFIVALGMSLFLSEEEGGGGGGASICVGAVGCCAAVLTVLQFALPIVGAGPTLGGLMGAAGAVGVSLSAAGATTDHYSKLGDISGLWGRIGLSLGAGAGAFLASCAHNGLSGIFMGVCAATVPAALCFEQLRKILLQKCESHRWILTTIIVLAILYLTFLLYCILCLFNLNIPFSLSIFLVLCFGMVKVGLLSKLCFSIPLGITLCVSCLLAAAYGLTPTGICYPLSWSLIKSLMYPVYAFLLPLAVVLIVGTKSSSST